MNSNLQNDSEILLKEVFCRAFAAFIWLIGIIKSFEYLIYLFADLISIYFGYLSYNSLYVYVTLFAYIFLYILSSTPVPVKHKDSNYSVFVSRILWYMFYSAWIFFMAKQYLITIDTYHSLFVVFTLSLPVYVNNLFVFCCDVDDAEFVRTTTYDFVYFLNLFTYRLFRIIKYFRPRVLYGMIMSLVLSYLTEDSNTFIFSLLIIFIEDIILNITSVISSEHVKFEKNDLIRLISDRKAHIYLRYLAFLDIYHISKGDSIRKRILFEDHKSVQILYKSMEQILNSYLKQLNSLNKQPNNIAHFSQASSRAFLNLQLSAINEIYIKPYSIFTYLFDRLFSSSMKSLEETYALQHSIVLKLCIETLANLFMNYQDDDTKGFLVREVKDIYPLLLKLDKELEVTLNYNWKTRTFANWSKFKTPTSLIKHMKHVIKSCVHILERNNIRNL